MSRGRVPDDILNLHYSWTSLYMDGTAVNFLADLPTVVIWVVEVPRQGYKIKIDFWLEINIQEENHCIL